MSEIVSIVTTLYNYKKFLPDLYDSIRNQTYSNWEWIIVDDASTDNPLAVLGPMMKGDPKIKYINFKKNSGYSVAKNEGIIASSGDYIVMIDADDMLTPLSIEVRLNKLKENSEYFWVHGRAYDYNTKYDTKIPNELFHKRWQKCVRSRNFTQAGMAIHAQTVMIKKDLHKHCGLYDEKLKCSSDREMWRRCIGLGYIPNYVNDYVCLYRKHSGQMHRSKYKIKNRDKINKLLEKRLKNRLTNGVSSENTRLL